MNYLLCSLLTILPFFSLSATPQAPAVTDIASAAGAASHVIPSESALTQEAEKNKDLFGDKNEKKDIYLNFEGADLKSFVEYIADLRGMNIIPDKSIAGNKISLNFRNPVSKSGAWNAFLTVLELANFSMIKVGNLYRVVARDKKFRQPLPTFIGVKSKDLPDNDATIRYVGLLDNLAAADVKDLLQSMLGQPSNLQVPSNVNGFIITDCSCTIKSAMQVIEALDQTGVEETVLVMSLKRANAQDVKELFDKLIVSKNDSSNALAKFLGKPSESNEYFAPGTRLFAETRTNKIIMLGQRQSLERIKNFIVEHVDTELQQAKSPLRVYELQNMAAADMATILSSATDMSNSSSPLSQQAAKYGAIRDGIKYFKNMKFQPDKEGNRLLVSCADDNDWELLKKTIAALDTTQPQVAMHMLIVTVDAQTINQLGGSIRNPSSGTLGGKADFQTPPIGNQIAFNTTPTVNLLGNMLNTLVLSQGAGIVTLGNFITGGNGIWGVLQALKTETNATVLSQPFAIAANCTETKLIVGSSMWIDTQQVSGGGSSTTGQSQVQANTTITFTPQVNSDGIIRLAINANLVDFVPGTSGASTTGKQLNTTVTVANGQVLAIGGFVKTQVSDVGSQMPVLGSIPIIGWLAKNLTRTVTKEYLFIFLCPTILKPRTAPGIGMYSKLQLHQAAKEVEDIIKTKKTNDPVYNWMFNASGENYSHKIIDFANARYQPNNVDVQRDPFYRSKHAEGAQTVQPMQLGTPPISPDTYWEEETRARKGAMPPQKTLVMPEQKTEEKTEKTNATPPNEVEPPAMQPVGPQMVTLATTPAETPQATPAPAGPLNLDDALAEKRARLRSLLGAKSLGNMLDQKEPLAAPVEDETDNEPQVTTFTLPRRRGLQSVFGSEDNGDDRTISTTEQPQGTPTSKGLFSLLGGN